MRTSLELAWYQLSHHKIKLLVASAGVVVAVMLMLVQLGIRQGALESSVALANQVESELVVTSPRTKSIFQASPFPRRLLYRLPAHPAVERVQEVYIAIAKIRNPWDHCEYPITAFGLETRKPLLRFPGFARHADELELPDRIIFDGMSRNKFGPITNHLKSTGPLSLEINYRRVDILDCINVGIPIGSDGAIYLSPTNFLRLFPIRSAGSIDMGLVKLKPNVDKEQVRRELADYLGAEAIVRTQPALVNDETLYVRNTAPLDFIFGMGAAVGFFIGFVVVYQILYTEVTNHLPHFATMKAMGFTDFYLIKVVLSQAFILSIFGYVPGAVLAMCVYRITTNAIQMPIHMTLTRAGGVFLLTLVMCGLSGLIAVRKARTADPADVF